MAKDGKFLSVGFGLDPPYGIDCRVEIPLMIKPQAVLTYAPKEGEVLIIQLSERYPSEVAQRICEEFKRHGVENVVVLPHDVKISVAADAAPRPFKVSSNTPAANCYVCGESTSNDRRCLLAEDGKHK